MKTDYSEEIETLIDNNFLPSTPEDAKATAHTLEEIHGIVINVLPAKWVYDSDVHTALEKLNFNTFYQTKEEKKGMFYFLIIK